MSNKRRILLQTFIVIVACIGLLGFYIVFGPPALLAKSESPEFCASCHVMESQYNNYMHSGAHRSFKCVDCHLPNDSEANHYLWKSIDGMKDAIHFYSGKVSENITLTDRGTKVLKANCIRCHETMVSQMNTSRNCWDCHRRITHIGTGAVQTRTLLQEQL